MRKCKKRNGKPRENKKKQWSVLVSGPKNFDSGFPLVCFGFCGGGLDHQDHQNLSRVAFFEDILTCDTANKSKKTQAFFCFHSGFFTFFVEQIFKQQLDGLYYKERLWLIRKSHAKGFKNERRIRGHESWFHVFEKEELYWKNSFCRGRVTFIRIVFK